LENCVKMELGFFLYSTLIRMYGKEDTNGETSSRWENNTRRVINLFDLWI